MIDNRILEGVCDLAKIVGNYIREENIQFDRIAVKQKKRFSDLVSYVDKTAEKKIVLGLKELLPGSGILAEEGTRDSGEYTWIIDPLDGTTNFVHKLPVFSVSIALEYKNEIILGVVYEINRDECFYALRGKGAWLNGESMKVSAASTLSESLIATGFPYYDFEKLDSYLKVLRSFMRSTQGLRRMGSAAVDLAYTACGRFEGFFEYNLNAWDVAAGSLLVQEAGGTVTNFNGGNDFLFGREILAAGPLHKEIMNTLKKSW